MKYYYSKNGEPVGPLSKDEIVAARITPDTLVWTEGMDVWVPAREMPMLADILNGSYRQNVATTPGAAPRPAGSPRPVPPAKHDFSPQSPEVSAPAPRPVIQPRPAPVQYYAIINDIKVGPMFIEDMKAAGVKRDTLVWKNGFAQWQTAGSVSELQPLFAGSAPVPPFNNTAVPPHNNTAGTPNINTAGTKVPPPPIGSRNSHRPQQQPAGQCLSYSTASVFAIVLGVLGVSLSLCGVYWNLVFAVTALVCGIMGCVKSSESSRLKSEGKMQEAINASKSAKAYCTVSFVMAVIGIAVVILAFVGLITLMATTDYMYY